MLISISKLCRRHSELIFNYNVGLKNLLPHVILERISYGDLVKVQKSSFPDQLKKITVRCKIKGYRMAIMSQSACLLITLITVYSYACLW